MKKDHKQTAVDFLQMIISGDIDLAYRKYTIPEMKHHNPYFPSDIASLQKGMEENHKEFPNKTFEIRRIIAEGEWIAVHSHLRMHAQDKGMATVHIFRFQDDKVVELWDVAQPVPEDVVNEKGMF